MPCNIQNGNLFQFFLNNTMLHSAIEYLKVSAVLKKSSSLYIITVPSANKFF